MSQSVSHRLSSSAVMISNPELNCLHMPSSRKPRYFWRRRAQSPATPAAHPRIRAFFAILCWLYIIAVITICLVLRFQGDRWWAATLVLFGPRWLIATPLPLLLPFARYARWRSLSGLALAAAIILFPVMDLEIPWKRLLPSDPHPSIRILTCNTHGIELNAQALAQVVADNRPDIVALQEWHGNTGQIVFANGPWHILREGELCLASRFPIRHLQSIGGSHWAYSGSATCYEIDAPSGSFSFINVHLESPHLAFLTAIHRSPEAEANVTRNSQQRLRQAERLRAAAESIGPSVVLAGDFNLPADSTIYRQTLSNLDNAFSTSGLGFGWSYYARWTVTRIDHILTGQSWRARKAWTGPNVGSPHRPLIADLEWIAPTQELFTAEAQR
jgi:vancomycin resistance protein VanJ